MEQIKKALKYDHFPSAVHAVIWRNWGMVEVENIAEVLKTTVDNVERTAEEMGLIVPAKVNKYWLERGYITIIRQNWHLLTLDQLLVLLGWNMEKLQYTLKEDDFLYHKLGYFKPDTDEITYKDICNDNIYFMREILDEYFPAEEGLVHKPFEFLKDFENKDVNYDEPLLKTFPKQFAEKAERSMNLSFKLTYDELNNSAVLSSDKGNLYISITENKELPIESHSIKLRGSDIYLDSVDERGVSRGLNWILKYYNTFINSGTDFVIQRKTKFEIRYVYSYFAVYGDPLLEKENDPYPDGLLEKLSDIGINGIWLQAVLYSLVPWKKAEHLSKGWEERIEGLKALVKRAHHYGIGVYLYFNEPRAMPEEFFINHPEWMGKKHNDLYSLCTSNKEIRDYLYDSSAELFKMVPDLEGLFTITMSENHTNCYSHNGSGGKISCPSCSKRTQAQVIAEVNNTIASGVFSVKDDAKVIAWAWGWDPSWSDEAIALLDKRIILMCTSEENMDTNVGGIQGKVLDYTLSIPGPGERASGNWRKAIDKGHKAVAKVQFNNTWECSAVPYLPVMNTLDRYMRNLSEKGVSGLMLSWTLGGYPSLNMEYSSQFWWDDGRKPDLVGFAIEKYNNCGETVADAWKAFSDAFSEFPFNIGTLYTGPQNYGPMNLFYETPTNYKATMIGFPYDDLKSWKSIYPEKVFEEQVLKLTQKWNEGIKLLESCDNHDRVLDLYRVSKACYCHFRSMFNQIRFVSLREGKANKEDILKVIDDELNITMSLYYLICEDSRIGYEASNHYYYTENALKEKVLNLEYLKGRYSLWSGM